MGEICLARRKKRTRSWIEHTDVAASSRFLASKKEAHPMYQARRDFWWWSAKRSISDASGKGLVGSQVVSARRALCLILSLVFERKHVAAAPLEIALLARSSCGESSGPSD